MKYKNDFELFYFPLTDERKNYFVIAFFQLLFCNFKFGNLGQRSPEPLLMKSPANIQKMPFCFPIQWKNYR